MIARRPFLVLGAIGVAALTLAACASGPRPQDLPAIVFVHGNGDSAALWQTTMWRFESNGWPRSKLHAIEVPFPLARDDDSKPQAGRTSAAENSAYLKAEVEKFLNTSGARQVVLMGNSRGGNSIRSYVQSGGGERTVSHAILGGTPNHGIWAVHIDGLSDNSEFAAQGALLTSLNAPKNAAGDEVTGPVKWMTIRSDKNDKYAQPDGLWVGKRGIDTGVTYAGPELKGATNVMIARADHRETAFSPDAFAAAHRFIMNKDAETTGVTREDHVVLSGNVTGLGVNVNDPATGNFANNLPLAGATLQIFAVDSNTAERVGDAGYSATIGADGRWGPFHASNNARYEFVLSAPGYATLHNYRSPFPRSSDIVNLRAERIAEGDRNAPTIVKMTRPRGYLDPARDRMVFDGVTPPPGAVLGAGVATSVIKPAYAASRVVNAEFNGERVIGRTWPAAQGHITTLEITY